MNDVFERMKKKSKKGSTETITIKTDPEPEPISKPPIPESTPTPTPTPIPTPTSRIKTKRKQYQNHELLKKLKNSDSDYAKKLTIRMYGNKKNKKQSYTFANNNRYFTTVSWVFDWLREEEVI